MILKATMLKKTKVKRQNTKYGGYTASVLHVPSFNLGLLQHGGLQDHLQKHSRESRAHSEHKFSKDFQPSSNCCSQCAPLSRECFCKWSCRPPCWRRPRLKDETRSTEVIPPPVLVQQFRLHLTLPQALLIRLSSLSH